jgi:hypothetical protein
MKIILISLKRKKTLPINYNNSIFFGYPKIDNIQNILDKILIGKLNYKRNIQIKWNP